MADLEEKSDNAEQESRECDGAESAKDDGVEDDGVNEVQKVMQRQPLNNFLRSPSVKGFYPLGIVVGQ